MTTCWTEWFENFGAPCFPFRPGTSDLLLETFLYKVRALRVGSWSAVSSLQLPGRVT